MCDFGYIENHFTAKFGGHRAPHLAEWLEGSSSARVKKRKREREKEAGLSDQRRCGTLPLCCGVCQVVVRAVSGRCKLVTERDPEAFRYPTQQ